MSVPTRISWAGGLVILAAALLTPSFADQPSAELAAALKTIDLERDIEVQARGLVHEAFAQAVDGPPQANPAVPRKPPEGIPELPAEERPDGAQWIPGYWAWDADRNDFIWISGVYRNAPPGRRYVPGYWIETPEGWRWVAGFWAPELQEEMTYTPEPPPSLDTGPTFAAPSDDYFYSPGYWSYSNRYYWRPGFWMPFRPGLVWIYPHWCWTPRGYTFINGYWDYPLERRGLLYAPVYFNRPLWATAGWQYRPRYAVGINAPWFSSLFNYGPRNYYFGDYYGRSYAGLGYRPWYAGSRYSDPLLGYYRWNNRNNPSWYSGVRQLAVDRYAGLAPLPPRTAAQQAVAINQTFNNPRTSRAGQANPLQVVTPVNQLRSPDLKLGRIDASQFNVQKAAAERVREVAQTRRNFESQSLNSPPLTKGGPGGASANPIKPAVANPPTPLRSFSKPSNDLTDSMKRNLDAGSRALREFKFTPPVQTPPANSVAVPKVTPPAVQGSPARDFRPATPALAPPVNSAQPATPKVTTPKVQSQPLQPPSPAAARPFSPPNTGIPPRSSSTPPSSPAPPTSASRSFSPAPATPRSFTPPANAGGSPSTPKSFSPPSSPPRSSSPPPPSTPRSFSPPSSSSSPRSISPPPSSSRSFSPPSSSPSRFSGGGSGSSSSRSFSPPSSSSSGGSSGSSGAGRKR